MEKKRVCLDYADTRENLFNLKEALTFIVEADKSDAGGCSKVAGVAYVKVAEEGLIYCNQAIEKLEKAASQEVQS